MSEIKTIMGWFDCDTPGCPAEFRVIRYLKPTDSGTDLPLDELLEIASNLKWKVEGEKAFCLDCLAKQP